jgi:hypothetical protein
MGRYMSVQITVDVTINDRQRRALPVVVLSEVARPKARAGHVREDRSVLHYFLRRLGGAIPTLFIIIAGTFFMMRLAPAGRSRASARCRWRWNANLMKAYHLDEPVAAVSCAT